MTTSDFLTTMWHPFPQGALLQIFELRDKRSTYWPSPRIEFFNDQPDVFMGVGLAGRSLGARHRAKASEVVAIAGVHLDIDVNGGPDNKTGACPHRTDALQLAMAHLPPSLLVNSGHGGLHAYWLFEDGPWVFASETERTVAAVLSQRWQALHRVTAHHRGFGVDSTHDLARLMRLPGTTNGKSNPPAPVTIEPLPSVLRYPRKLLADLCSKLPAEALSVARSALSDDALDLTGEAPMFAAKLDTLMENHPPFAASWEHQGRPEFSASEWDLSLCSLAADAMNDDELVALIRAHRTKWGDHPEKADRETYQRFTIMRARSRAHEEAA